MSERDLQAENERWAKHNFHEKEFADIAFEIVSGLPVGGPDLVGAKSPMVLAEQVRKILFKRLGHFMPFVGMVEEIGELAHALLKKRQGIRRNQDHDADARDAYGDLRVYGLDFCNRMMWVDNEVLLETWDQVMKRDWVKDPVGGKG